MAATRKLTGCQTLTSAVPSTLRDRKCPPKTARLWSCEHALEHRISFTPTATQGESGPRRRHLSCCSLFILLVCRCWLGEMTWPGHKGAELRLETWLHIQLPPHCDYSICTGNLDKCPMCFNVTAGTMGEKSIGKQDSPGKSGAPEYSIYATVTSYSTWVS